jgi:effector-binding domain-containing protein
MVQTKEVKPINFLYFRAETRLDQLTNFLPIGQQLIKEALGLNIWVTGPVHWHYFGFVDPDTSFTLEVSIPVSEIPKDYDGNFHFKRTEPFKCISIVHEGSWLNMPQSYEKLMKFMEKNKVQPTAINRELYVNADFTHAEANVTEIQMGIR